jgi:beta-glucosidase
MAYTRAGDAIRRMTNEEKQNITMGISPSPNGCVGFSGGAGTINFSGLCLQDGPTGVRGTDFVTSFPSGLHIGASWNTELAFEIAKYMGAEFRVKGGQNY